MQKGLVPPEYGEYRVQNVAPAAISIEHNPYLIRIGAERMLEKCGGTYAVFGIASACAEHQLGRVRSGLPRSDRNLAAWNR